MIIAIQKNDIEIIKKKELVVKISDSLELYTCITEGLSQQICWLRSTAFDFNGKPLNEAVRFSIFDLEEDWAGAIEKFLEARGKIMKDNFSEYDAYVASQNQEENEE